MHASQKVAMAQPMQAAWVGRRVLGPLVVRARLDGLALAAINP